MLEDLKKQVYQGNRKLIEESLVKGTFLRCHAVNAGDLFLLKDDLFLPRQFIVDFFNDKVEVTAMGDIIEIVSGNSEHRAERELFNP